jgi:tRNA pseudouridine38-40 synthase
LKIRYFIQLSYKGTNYHGWQVQPNAQTVQEIVEKALALVFNQSIQITGAGRTDTGVHAIYYIAHVDLNKEIEDISKAIYRINSILPADIAIHNIVRVKNEAHARFDAISRTYEYRISTKKDPFLFDYCYYLYGELDINLMNQACSLFKNYNDFTSFSKLHTDTKTNNCRIYLAEWKSTNDLIIFNIKADRFLRNMVRAIVGTLLKIGQGKIGLKELERIIENRSRSDAGKSVPAKGLFLVNIEYPESIYHLI